MVKIFFSSLRALRALRLNDSSLRVSAAVKIFFSALRTLRALRLNDSSLRVSSPGSAHAFPLTDTDAIIHGANCFSAEIIQARLEYEKFRERFLRN